MLWKIVLSGLFLIFSFPNFNLSYLVFISFIPLFFAVENKSPQRAFLIFFIAGFIFYLGTLYWLYHVTVIGFIILCLYLALYFGVFGWILVGGGFKTRPYIFLIPFIWVILEYIQANISIMGFGWTLLGYSQYKNLPLIQIADFSGVYGVSFVVMMVNLTIYKTFKEIQLRRLDFSSRRSWIMICSVLIITYAYGFFRLNESRNPGLIKVSVIQGNIPQELKWDPDAQDMIIEKYIALTKMSALDNPDLIVWPETSFPGFFETDKEMTDEVLSLAKEIRVPILIGANREGDQLRYLPSADTAAGAVEKVDYFNSAVLISGEGEIVDTYDKIHLVPFGEYVPFSNKFPAMHKLVLGELGEFTPGTEFKIFVVDRHASPLPIKFGVLICYEDIFPKLAGRFVKNGAKFLVVITNDAWYGKSGAPYQHAACSVFRAIENRVPVIRSANTGYSCFIDSRGRIYDSVEQNNTHLFITGYKTSEVDYRY
ncbi:MAG: apolipoprotein N-acyltransferase [Candidatus Omnitrophota bacterium]